jgi:hypothetical protein
MAVTTTVFAYFVDLLPQVVDNNVALIGSSNDNTHINNGGSAKDN